MPLLAGRHLGQQERCQDGYSSRSTPNFLNFHAPSQPSPSRLHLPIALPSAGIRRTIRFGGALKPAPPALLLGLRVILPRFRHRVPFDQPLRGHSIGFRLLEPRGPLRPQFPVVGGAARVELDQVILRPRR